MAKLALASFFLMLLSFGSVCNLGLAAAGGNKGPWCIARPLAPLQHLQDNIDFACGNGGVNCKNFWGNEGLPCFTNDTVSRASLAMNAYYQKQGKTEANCAFTDTRNSDNVPSGLIVTNNPDYGTSTCFSAN